MLNVFRKAVVGARNVEILLPGHVQASHPGAEEPADEVDGRTFGGGSGAHAGGEASGHRNSNEKHQAEPGDV